MLKSIRIRQFQSHSDSNIEFSPYLTVIVGENNSGKSALLRALSKVIRNTPDGDGFVSFGAKGTEIVLTTDAGVVVRRVTPKRGAKGNVYEVNNVPFMGFGKDIPQEVFPILQVNMPILFGDIELDVNFGRQFDGFFLIDDTGSARGKILGKVAGVDVVGRKLQVVASRKTQASQELVRLSKSTSELAVEINRLAPVDEWIDSVNSMTKHVEFIKASQQQYLALGQMFTTSQTLQTSQKQLMQSITGLVHADTLSVDPIREKSLQLQTLQTLQARIVALQSQLDGIVIPSLPKIDLEIVQEKAVLLKDLYGVMRKANSLQASVSAVETELEILEQDAHYASNALEVLKQQLGTCPVCGKPF